MFHIILYQPQIPPNTGNVVRLCANSGTALHLIRPLGFDVSDKAYRRAGLDYHEMASVTLHDDLAGCLRQIGQPRLYAITKFGERRYSEVAFQPGNALLYGSEVSGLPHHVLALIEPAQRLYIPMLTHNRSLNLGNSVALTLYEAWRQQGFCGSTAGGSAAAQVRPAACATPSDSH